MSLIVSDTGPLRYLVLCRQVHLLGILYGQVVIPEAVARELSQDHTPAAVKAWLAQLPSWALVRHPARLVSDPELGPGEVEAISLALEFRASRVLMDDLAARHAAVRHGLAVTGTLGVIELAASRQLVNFDSAIQTLLETNIRLDPKLVAEARRRVSSS